MRIKIDQSNKFKPNEHKRKYSNKYMKMKNIKKYKILSHPKNIIKSNVQINIIKSKVQMKNLKKYKILSHLKNIIKSNVQEKKVRNNKEETSYMVTTKEKRDLDAFLNNHSGAFVAW